MNNKTLLLLVCLFTASHQIFAGVVSEYDTSVCRSFKVQPLNYQLFAKEIRITSLIANHDILNRVGNKIDVELVDGQKFSTKGIFIPNQQTFYKFKNFTLTLEYVRPGGVPNSNIGEDVYDFQLINNYNIITKQRMGCTK